MTPHSSTLAWKIPGAEEPGRLQSMGSLRVGHDWVTSLSLSRIGERNGNPLQCSCLENPRDRGAWWAAVYGATQSWTRLKWLSSRLSNSLSFAFQNSFRTINRINHQLFLKKFWSLHHVQLFVTPWTVIRQAPLSMEFSRQEYWSGLPFPSPGDLPDPGIEPRSPALQADSLPNEPPWKTNYF